MTGDELKMLDETMDAESGLSERELEFLEDLDNNYRDRDLTGPQSRWLASIASRVCS